MGKQLLLDVAPIEKTTIILNHVAGKILQVITAVFVVGI